MSNEWYESLSQIIGPFDNLVEVDRSRLHGASLTPRLVEGWDGEEYLQWDAIEEDEAGSQSPVAQKAVFHHDDEENPMEPSAICRVISEAVLLPGLAADYHFALMHAYSMLWHVRRQDSSILIAVERLCLLDVRLAEARPSAVEIGGGHEGFVRVPAFHHLMTLYRDEGYVAEAIAVGERAQRFEPAKGVEELRERMAALEAEDA